MTTKEFYLRMGASYDEVLRRFGKKERITRFLSLLPEDKCYSSLCISIEKKDAEEAFRAAHTLKGICMNLGLSNLCVLVSALTEELRGKEITDKAEVLFMQVDEEYRCVIQNLKELLQI